MIDREIKEQKRQSNFPCVELDWRCGIYIILSRESNFLYVEFDFPYVEFDSPCGIYRIFLRQSNWTSSEFDLPAESTQNWQIAA